MTTHHEISHAELVDLEPIAEAMQEQLDDGMTVAQALAACALVAADIAIAAAEDESTAGQSVSEAVTIVQAVMEYVAQVQDDASTGDDDDESDALGLQGFDWGTA